MVAMILMHSKKHLRGIKDHATYISLKWIAIFINIWTILLLEVKKTKFEYTCTVTELRYTVQVKKNTYKSMKWINIYENMKSLMSWPVSVSVCMWQTGY